MHVFFLLYVLKCVYTQNVYIDPCIDNLCQSGGSCIRIGDGSNYLCACTAGRWGQHCEFVPGEVPCDGNKCHSGSTCRPDAKESLKYRCICPKEYYGQFCDQPKTKTPQQRCEATCGARGTATLNRKKECKCKCIEHMYEGKFCNETLPCASMPCKNGGNCKSHSTGTKYTCFCGMYYVGETCEKPKWCESGIPCPPPDPCTDYCRNGGKCSYRPKTVKKSGGWVDPVAQCTCEPGYQGDRCQTQSNPCLLTDGEQFCNKNLDISDPDADTLKICGELKQKIEVCYNGGDCRVAGRWPNQTKICDCKSPWVGQDCTLENICLVGNGNCTKNSTCISVTSEHGGKFGHICLCQPGYSADDCHALDPNVCSGDKVTCHFGGICVSCFTNSSKVSPYCRTREDFLRHYVCACPIRRTGPLCDQTTLPCDIRRCKNGGVCVDMNETDYECRCLDGYSGRHCEIIDDMCLARSPCLNGGTCQTSDTLVYRFFCNCKPGYYGIACQQKHYEFAGYFISFHQFLAIWSFICGAIVTVVFGFLYWMFLNCLIKTKEKQL